MPLGSDCGLLDCADRIQPEYEDHNELIRVPAVILLDLESNLKAQQNFVIAWLQAVLQARPGCSLLDLLQREPGLFPGFLQRKERVGSIQVCTSNVSQTWVLSVWRQVSAIANLDLLLDMRFICLPTAKSSCLTVSIA